MHGGGSCTEEEAPQAGREVEDVVVPVSVGPAPDGKRKGGNRKEEKKRSKQAFEERADCC